MDEELEIKAYYAGHVLGAAMFQIKVGCESVVYTVSMPRFRMISLLLPLDIPRSLHCLKNITGFLFSPQGDYNMTPDRHLG